MFTSTLFVDNKASGNITLTLQKLRMLQIQGVKGDAVVHYCEPLTIRQRRTSAADVASSAFPNGQQQDKAFLITGCHLLYLFEKSIERA